MATARKLPSGNYRVRVYDKHLKKYKSFTAETKKEAERSASEWLKNSKRKTNINTFTFADAAQLYIASRKDVLSPTTIHSYEMIARNNCDMIADYDIEEISPHLVQRWVNSLAVSKAPKTVHNMYGFFTAVMKYNDIDIKLGTVKLPAKKRKFKNLPTADIIINTFKGNPIELPVLIAVYTGMRLSEILGIRKQDIDSNNILTINQVRVKVGNEWILKPNAKTYSSNRQILLAKPIMALIEKTDTKPKDLLIQFNGTQIYQRFVKRMKKEGYSISFHDLRHINASVMAMLNVPDVYAMERGGWSNTSTLRQVYQQTFTEQRKAYDNLIDGYFNKIYDTKI